MGANTEKLKFIVRYRLVKLVILLFFRIVAEELFRYDVVGDV